MRSTSSSFGTDMTEYDQIQNNSSWRDKWFVANVLAELPLINGFCKSGDRTEILYETNRKMVVLLVASMIMMNNIFDIRDTDTMAMKALKTVGAMSISMACASIGHNVATFFYDNREKIRESCHFENNAMMDRSSYSADL